MCFSALIIPNFPIADTVKRRKPGFLPKVWVAIRVTVSAPLSNFSWWGQLCSHAVTHLAEFLLSVRGNKVSLEVAAYPVNIS